MKRPALRACTRPARLRWARWNDSVAGGMPQMLADGAGENAIRPGLDEQTEDRQARLVAERGEPFGSGLNFPIFPILSKHKPTAQAISGPTAIVRSLS